MGNCVRLKYGVAHFLQLVNEFSLNLIENVRALTMDFDLCKKMDFQLAYVIHIGAHKFEELNDYQSILTKEVIWVDPLETFLPDSLPPGHSFLKYFVTSDDATHSEFNTYEATGFSSAKLILSPGNILFGTPERYSQSSVPNISGYSIQRLLGTHSPVTVCIDVQGSEWEVLNSLDLSKVSETIVETSRKPLYVNSKPHKEIVKLMKSAGFSHNFNTSDFFIGHGDQYFSRQAGKYQISQWVYRSRQSFYFVLSITSRLFTAAKIRLN